MKKLLLLVMLITTLAFSQEILDEPGPHWLWQGDTLKTGVTKISSSLYTGHWPYVGIYIKTTNPVDSTKYRISFKSAFDTDDVFAIPSDSLGSEYMNTIMRVSDTLWHIRSISAVCAPLTKIIIEADNTDHGDRARIWIKVYLWRPGYWRE